MLSALAAWLKVYFTSCIMRFRQRGNRRALMACSVLLLLSLINEQTLGIFIYFALSGRLFKEQGNHLFSVANHFVLSPELVAYFSLLLLLLLKTLKLETPSVS